MQRLRRVTSLNVSAVVGHHALPAALLFGMVSLSREANRKPQVTFPCINVGEVCTGGGGGNIYSAQLFYLQNYRYYGIYFSPPGRVAQSVGHLTRKSGVLGSIPGLATYFRFSFLFFKKGSCQLPAKVCARSTG